MKIRRLCRLTSVLALAVASSSSLAQKMPPASRTVFKCEKDGRVLYSDEPCTAAKRLEVQPTRGLTTTGKERPGVDVRNERFNEQMGEALQPLTGKDPQQFEVSRRRVYLQPEVQRECRALDIGIRSDETRERTAKDAELAKVQADLLRHRNRFRELRC